MKPLSAKSGRCTPVAGFRPPGLPGCACERDRDDAPAPAISPTALLVGKFIRLQPGYGDVQIDK